MPAFVGGVLALGLLFQSSNSLPLAHFTGTVHGATKKELTVDTEEGNTVAFTLTRKTKITRNGKQIQPQDLKTGEPVAVDARQELLGYLDAVTVTAQAK